MVKISSEQKNWGLILNKEVWKEGISPAERDIFNATSATLL